MSVLPIIINIINLARIIYLNQANFGNVLFIEALAATFLVLSSTTEAKVLERDDLYNI